MFSIPVWNIMLSVSIPLVLVGCILCFVPAQRGAREATPERACEMNVALLGSGIEAYRKEHGDLPPFLVGPKGDKHSWRSLIVP